jgi:hypothetical protein
VNIGEVIASLQAKARELPNGFDTEVCVSMCDGEGIETTRAVEVDHLAEVAPDSGQVIDYVALIQGHPHADERSFRAQGVAHQADDVLRQWTEDDQG